MEPPGTSGDVWGPPGPLGTSRASGEPPGTSGDLRGTREPPGTADPGTSGDLRGTSGELKKNTKIIMFVKNETAKNPETKSKK